MDGSAREVAAVALRLGLVSFGGPTAHIGVFRQEYVDRRRWVDEAQFGELLALCQLLPGPTSSQLGALVGYLRAGWRGAVAAWLCFTTPSALALAGAAAWAASAAPGDQPWVRALMCVAVAVVANAVVDMARSLVRGPARIGIAVLALVVTLFAPFAWVIPAVVALCAGAGAWGLRGPAVPLVGGLARTPSRRAGAALLVALPTLLVALTILAGSSAIAAVAASTAWAGSMVFGGGHVVLPILADSMVPDLVSSGQFVAGYGLAQAVPGPLFTFASYLGMAAAGVAGALAATVAIFAPGMLLAFGVLPSWSRIRTHPRAAGAVAGASAAVVGILAATWLDPLLVEAVTNWQLAALAVALGVLNRFARWPAWGLVLVALTVGALVPIGPGPLGG